MNTIGDCIINSEVANAIKRGKQTLADCSLQMGWCHRYQAATKSSYKLILLYSCIIALETWLKCAETEIDTNYLTSAELRILLSKTEQLIHYNCSFTS
jgi:hypothetical protein